MLALQLSSSDKSYGNRPPPFFNGAYTIITDNDDINKESTRIWQVLKKNGYH